MTGKQRDKHSSDIDEHDQPTEPMSQVVLSPFSPTVPRPCSTLPYRNQNWHGPQPNEGSLPQQSRDNFSPQGVLFPSPHTSTYPRVWPVTGTNRNGQPLQPAQIQPRPSSLPVIVAIVFVAVQLLLLIRFVLQLFISPGNTLWVNLIYALSSIFILPFRLLLQSIALPIPLGTELLNPLAILLAILIYGLFSRLLVRFLKALLNSR